MEKSQFIKDKINELRAKIGKPAIVFETQKIKVAKVADEDKVSWIGRVFLCKENEKEEKIIDDNGIEMYPLAQFYLGNLPYVPESLKEIKYITIFMGEEFSIEAFSKNGENWLLRTYTDKDILVKSEYLSNYELKPEICVLIHKFVKQDFPLWINEVLECEYGLGDEILSYGDSDDPNKFDFSDFVNDDDVSLIHKFEGYPFDLDSMIGSEPIKNYKFVFQIGSDKVANFDREGTLLFYYNEIEDDWTIFFDWQ